MTLKDDFSYEVMDFIKIGNTKGKKFKRDYWNKEVLPMCKKLCKYEYIKLVKADYDEHKNVYRIFACTCRAPRSGWNITMKPGPNNISLYTVAVEGGTDLGDCTLDEVLEILQSYSKLIVEKV